MRTNRREIAGLIAMRLVGVPSIDDVLCLDSISSVCVQDVVVDIQGIVDESVFAFDAPATADLVDIKNGAELIRRLEAHLRVDDAKIDASGMLAL
jgi:hypothetical protein